MVLNRIKLLNFRNYQSQELEFHPHNNVITGGNAQGKSNLIEAIYYLSHLKSKRTSLTGNLLMGNSEQMSLEGEVFNGSQKARIKVDVSQSGRNLEVNGRKSESTAVLGFLLKTVLFSPEDLVLTKGGPAMRREYLDETAAEVTPGFEEILNRYRHILKQRNAILKNWENQGEKLAGVLSPWDGALLDFGARIVGERLKIMESVKGRIGNYYKLIAGKNDDIELKYSPTFVAEGELVDNMKKALEESAEEEKRLRTTIVGPHRDSVEISIRGMDARFCASQGEQRTIALGMRLSQRDCIVEETGSVPVLLLDDVLSELDRERRRRVVECTEGKGQLFITTTAVDGEKISGEANKFIVEDGVIKVA